MSTGLLLSVGEAGIVSGDIFTFTDLRDFMASAAAEVSVLPRSPSVTPSSPPPQITFACSR